MRGTMTYDPAARGSNPRPGVGRYEFRQTPFGILIEAGQYVFQTDPAQVDVSIELSNDEGTPPRDSFLMNSRNNLPLSNGAAVSRISWQLVDDTSKALENTRLSAAAPDLDPMAIGIRSDARRAGDRRIHHQSARDRSHAVHARDPLPVTTLARSAAPQLVRRESSARPEGRALHHDSC